MRDVKKRRVSYTDEVDDESPVGEAAAGMTKVRLTVRESASGHRTTGEEVQVSGVGERVAESEDGGVTAAANSREDQQVEEETQGDEGRHLRAGDRGSSLCRGKMRCVDVVRPSVVSSILGRGVCSIISFSDRDMWPTLFFRLINGYET